MEVGVKIADGERLHKECFCPATVNYWNLQAVDRYARQAWEFVNLYSVDRGANRFLTLEKVLEMLDRRKEVKRLTGFSMPDHSELKKWVESGEPLNNQSLEKHKDNPQLAKTLAWSLDCNRRISEMVRGVPPFPYVRESLEKLASQADIVIVSATATEALMREWAEHDLLPLVSTVCGQEAGNKAQCIAKAKQSYQADHCLMMGDAPGDYAAAQKNGILFYPIRPLEEGLAAGLDMDSVILALSMWEYYFIFRGSDGKPMPIDDPKADILLGVADNPSEFLNAAGLSDKDPAFEKVSADVGGYLLKLREYGVEKVLSSFLCI